MDIAIITPFLITFASYLKPLYFQPSVLSNIIIQILLLNGEREAVESGH